MLAVRHINRQRDIHKSSSQYNAHNKEGKEVQTHRRKLGQKNIVRAGVRASGTGVEPRAQPKVVLGWAWKGIGLGSESNSYTDSLEWGRKIVGYEKAEFSEMCKWNLRDQ